MHSRYVAGKAQTISLPQEVSCRKEFLQQGNSCCKQSLLAASCRKEFPYRAAASGNYNYACHYHFTPKSP